MILKKGWFSDHEILETYKQINKERFEQDLQSQIETLNTEKQKVKNWMKIQNIENWNTINSSTQKLMLTQEEKICWV